EQVARPLLALLGRFTGMESTYLASADSERGVVRIEFARNVGDMTVSEGLEVPWEDTLCKRALDEGRHYADDVMACWGDSELAPAGGPPAPGPRGGGGGGAPGAPGAGAAARAPGGEGGGGGAPPAAARGGARAAAPPSSAGAGAPPAGAGRPGLRTTGRWGAS